MSAATLAPPRRPAAPTPGDGKLFTIADLDSLPTELAGCPVDYEIHHGRLVVMAPPGYFHGRRQNRISYELTGQAELRGLGVASGEVGIILGRNPDHLLGADAAFILKESLPPKVSKEGFLESMPEIVVEVRSKNDTMPRIRVKAEEYLAAGAKEMWLIDGVKQSATIYKADGTVAVLTSTDILTSPLLPGFALPLAEYFAGE
jgi:Uma2 family endonuclease